MDRRVQPRAEQGSSGCGLSRREEPAGLPDSPREGIHEGERDFTLVGEIKSSI